MNYMPRARIKLRHWVDLHGMSAAIDALERQADRASLTATGMCNTAFVNPHAGWAYAVLMTDCGLLSFFERQIGKIRGRNS